MSLEHFIWHTDANNDRDSIKGIMVTFIAPASGTLTDFNIILTSGNSQQFTAEIFAAGTDGKPTGSAICSKTGCAYQFGFNNPNTFTTNGSVTAGNRYVLKLSVTTAGTFGTHIGNTMSLSPYEFSVRTSYDLTSWVLGGYGGTANFKIGGSWYGTCVHRWTGSDSVASIYAVSGTNINRAGTIVRPTKSGTIKGVQFTLAYSSGLTGTVEAKIYSGTTLLGTSLNTFVTTGFAAVTWIPIMFDFEGVSVTAGSEYYVVLSPVGYWGSSSSKVYALAVYNGIALGYGGQTTDADKKLDGQIGYVSSTVDSATPSWTANNSAHFPQIRLIGEPLSGSTVLIED